MHMFGLLYSIASLYMGWSFFLSACSCIDCIITNELFYPYRFNQLNQYLIEFNQLAMDHAEGSESMLNRVMPRDNISIAVVLKLQTNSGVRLPCQHILVANAHIHWDPEFADVKLIQIKRF